jgi:hypothetical protein
MARRRKKNWIKGAVKRPGQLHRDLGVRKGKKIPRSKLQAAAKRKGKVGQRARFALNMRKINARKRRKGSGKRKRTSSRRRRSY